MKKSVIIFHRSLYCGGIETSLINLANSVKDFFDLKVVLLAEGERTSQLLCDYETVGIDSVVDRYQKSYSEQMSNTKNIIEKIKIFSTKVLARLKLMDDIIARKIKKSFNCDIGICFSCEEGLFKAYKKCVKSKYNICFVHSDVSKSLDMADAEEKLKFFDKIICVSKGCAQIFRDKFPTIADKVDYLYNILDGKIVRQKAEELVVQYDEKKLNIVSVSRMSEEKGFCRMLNALEKIKSLGFDFCWNIVGDSDCEEKTKFLQALQEKNMQKYIKFWGVQKNPYPYIKAADLLLLGSYHESWGLVLIESMLVGVPVLTTKTASSTETVGTDEKYGIVCENNEDSMVEALKNIFENKKKLEAMRKNLKKYEFDNNLIIEKFIKICTEG